MRCANASAAASFIAVQERRLMGQVTVKRAHGRRVKADHVRQEDADGDAMVMP